MRVVPLHLRTSLVVLAGAIVVALGVVAIGIGNRDVENPFADFRLEPAQTSLVRVTNAEQIPDETAGVYFLNIETGDIDGWYDPRGETEVVAFSGDNRLVAFLRGSPVNPPTTNLTGKFSLADRHTGAIYTWQGVLSSSSQASRSATTSLLPSMIVCCSVSRIPKATIGSRWSTWTRSQPWSRRSRHQDTGESCLRTGTRPRCFGTEST